MTDEPIFHVGIQEPPLVYVRADHLKRLVKIRLAAERVCWFDWSDNDGDAVRAVDELRALLGSHMTTISIAGIRLRKEGEFTLVEVELGDEWIEVIRERSDSNFCHIVEPKGIAAALFATSEI